MNENKNKTVMIVLAGVLVVLVVVIGFMFSQRQGDVAANQGTQNAQNAQNGQDGSGMSSNIKEVDFDVKTATKLAKGETPQKYLEKYLTAVDKKDWDTAFEMLPLDRKNYYKDAATYGKQLEGYGIASHKEPTVVNEGKDADGNKQLVLKSSMVTDGNGTWSYDWTFVEIDGVWYAKTRGTVIME